MSVKRKLTREEKHLRRMKELSKAQSNSKLGYKMNIPGPESLNEGKNKNRDFEIAQNTANIKYTLPINQIKKDLWKNLFYVIFAVGLVVTLKITGAGFDQIKHLLAF